MDNQNNPNPAVASRLPLEAAGQAQPSSPAAAAEKATAEKAITTGKRTQARVGVEGKARAVKTGARAARRKGEPVARPSDDEDRVAVVMTTSKVTGRNGRAVPRRTVAWVLPERGIDLLMKDQAREATATEAKAAREAPVFID